MINILKLRKLEKEKSTQENQEIEIKPVNPDDEIVSLDEGKIVEEPELKEEKKKDKKDSKKKKDKKESKKDKNHKHKKKDEDEEDLIPAFLNDINADEEVEIDSPLTEISLEQEDIPEEEKIDIVIEEKEDPAEALRRKLLEELMAMEDFSKPQEDDDNPADYGVDIPTEEQPVTEQKIEVADSKPEEVPQAVLEQEVNVEIKEPGPSAEPLIEQIPIDSIGEDELKKKDDAINKFLSASKTAKKDVNEKTDAEDNKQTSVNQKEELIKNIADAKDQKATGEKTLQLIGFVLGNELYGFDINDIKEINRITAITVVPNVPDYVEGVINLRGNVIPIINLRLKTKMPKTEFNAKTRIIIIERDNLIVGFIVDEVKEVIRIPESIVAPPPAIAVTESSEYINAVARTENGLIILLDTSKLLSRADFKK